MGEMKRLATDMEPVKWSATEALSQLDKVDLQFIKGIINAGDRDGQRLVIMLHLIAWAKMETHIRETREAEQRCEHCVWDGIIGWHNGIPIAQWISCDVCDWGNE
jgi:hypothetical protein